MVTGKSPVEFYFDFASPYGYLGSLRIDRVAAQHGREVTWRPILLGAVFKVTGAVANVKQPLRGDYLRRDTARCARELNVPFCFPAVMPISPVAASRAFYWLDAQDPRRAVDLAHVLYDAHWGQGQDIEASEAVAGVAAATLGIDSAALLAGIVEPAVKDRLRRETEIAISRGVFGAPFLFVDGEPFWGNDRLDQVDRWLTTGGW